MLGYPFWLELAQKIRAFHIDEMNPTGKIRYIMEGSHFLPRQWLRECMHSISLRQYCTLCGSHYDKLDKQSRSILLYNGITLHMNVWDILYNEREISTPRVLSLYHKMTPHKNIWEASYTLPWRHNDHDGVSNHQPHGCLFKRLFRRRSKKTSKLRVTGLCVGNSPGPVNSPHKGPVTRTMFPFDDVIMQREISILVVIPLIKHDGDRTPYG